MRRSSAEKRIFVNVALFVLFFTLTLFSLPPYSNDARAEERQINGGPYSLTIRGGMLDDATNIGADARGDFLNPFLNLHIFGTYDLLDAGKGIGQVFNQRYGAGFALSHTYALKANVFAGTSFINELNEYFGHAYIGGKVKVADNAIITASYGFGLGNEQQITRNLTKFLTAQSADWGRLGVIYVGMNGLKANLYYYLIDPWHQDISGVEGDLSYPVTDNITLGVNGTADLSARTDVYKNWKTQAYLTYAFGYQKGSPIDLALEKNNPAVYPMIIHKTGERAATAGTPLSISPTSAYNAGCSAPNTVFNASGGTGPYTWSTTDPITSDLKSNCIGGCQALWRDTGDNYCSSGGTFNVTVTDSKGATATAILSVGAI